MARRALLRALFATFALVLAALADAATGERHVTGAALAYVTPWNGAGYTMAKQFAGKFTHVAPVWYNVDPAPDDTDPTRPLRLVLSGAHDVDAGWIAAYVEATARAPNNSPLTASLPGYAQQGARVGDAGPQDRPAVHPAEPVRRAVPAPGAREQGAGPARGAAGRRVRVRARANDRTAEATQTHRHGEAAEGLGGKGLTGWCWRRRTSSSTLARSCASWPRGCTRTGASSSSPSRTRPAQAPCSVDGRTNP